MKEEDFLDMQTKGEGGRELLLRALKPLLTCHTYVQTASIAISKATSCLTGLTLVEIIYWVRIKQVTPNYPRGNVKSNVDKTWKDLHADLTASSNSCVKFNTCMLYAPSFPYLS